MNKVSGKSLLNNQILSRNEINEVFNTFHQNNPDPKTELEYNNLYTLLIAVVMSAQATDVSVNKATKNLFENYSTPEKILELGEEGLKRYIKSIGLFNSKANNIINLSKILIEKYNSEVPLDFDKLVNLPGVGRKTANVVLNCWLGAETMPVDTHVYRVAKRIGLAASSTIIAVEKELIKNIPKKFLAKAHHWLILHGRYICKARKPKCNECVIVGICKSKDKT